jgi:hypothetical protein
MPQANKKPVPSAALAFSSAVEFDAQAPNQAAVPVRMVARSGQPIDHWFWGRVVHDLAGFKLHKSSIPIDYAHDVGEVLGYLNKFEVTADGLVCSGAVVPFKAEDRGAEVLAKQKLGVPYEASINFNGDGIRVEEVPAGYAVDVNGYKFEGPGCVIREWPLRGVAICPYGADMNTATEFSATDSPTRAVTFFQETDMSVVKLEVAPAPVAKEEEKSAVEGEAEKKAAEEATPADGEEEKKAAAAKAAAEEEPAKELAAAHAAAAPFVKAFGQAGALWFLEGKTFAQAAELHLAASKAQHDAELTKLKGELADAKTKLAAAGKAGNPAVPFNDATKPAGATGTDTKTLSAKLGENVAKVAASIKLPGKAAPAAA